LTDINLAEKIDLDYQLGAVQTEGKVSFYLNPLAYWIMDYKVYDPTYRPDDWPGPRFRNDLLQVDESTVVPFLNAMAPDEVTLESIIQHLPAFGETLVPLFLIDFDNRLFVNGYGESRLEDYIPSGWKGIFDNPINYLPEPIRQIWL
jgi:hypothetical protein